MPFSIPFQYNLFANRESSQYTAVEHLSMTSNIDPNRKKIQKENTQMYNINIF